MTETSNKQAANSLEPDKRSFPPDPLRLAPKEILQFLYDKRLNLFNTRREHEWKIYFGAFGLLVAFDAALVARGVVLSPIAHSGWAVICIVLVWCCLGYEHDLQVRNKGDRKAMDAIYNALCDQAGVPVGCGIREREGQLKSKPLGWAYQWQAMLLIVFALFSAFLPSFVPPEPPSKSAAATHSGR